MSVLSAPVLGLVRRQPGSTAPRSTIDVSLNGPTLVAVLRNRDAEPLTVHARSFTLAGTPTAHTVDAGGELNAAWQSEGNYDLSLYAPHGTYRRIAGLQGEAQVEASLRVRGGRVTLHLFNPLRQPMEVRVEGGGRTRSIRLTSFSRREVAVRVVDGAYEAHVHVVGTESQQVLAGHL